MLRLDNTTRKLQLVLGGAVSANQLPVMVSFSEQTATAYSGSSQLSSSNGATAVDICDAPAASTIRDIDYINVFNADTAAADVTIQLDDNATDYKLITVTLAVGDHLTYTHGSGWQIVSATGLRTMLTAQADSISFTPAGTIAAADVQAAIEELDTEVYTALADHITDPADAHDASAISYLGSTSLSATDVEGALDELDTEKAPLASPTFTGTATASGKLIAGDPGTEATGITISSVAYESTFKVSDIDGTNYAQTILHRHSTILEPLIVGARSNSDTSSHAAVTAGQGLFTIFAAGSVDASADYKLFGSMSFQVGTGTVGATSAPGKWVVGVTPDGGVSPVAAITVDSDGLTELATGLQTPLVDAGTPSSNAQYMYLTGDEAGAWLASTTAETVVGGAVVTDDGSSTANWTLNTGWAHDAGNTEFDHTPGNTGTSTRAVTGLTSAKTYGLYIVTGNRTAGTLTVSLSTATDEAGDLVISANGTALIQFTSAATTDTVVITPSTDYDGSVQSLSIVRAEFDLTANAHPLEYYGSLVHSAVAPGAALMWESGYSAANYRGQPQNADFDPGTGDFMLEQWVQMSANSAQERILTFGYWNGSAWVGSLIAVFVGAAGTVSMYVSDDGTETNDTVTSAITIDDGVGRRISAGREGSNFVLYINDTLHASVPVSAAALTLTNTSATLRYGVTQSATFPLTHGKLALARVTIGTVTAAMIKDNYDYEVGFTPSAAHVEGIAAGFGTKNPTQLVDVNDDSLRVRRSKTPASAAAAGDQGEIAWDASYVYVCVDTDTWKRAALSSW